MPFWIQIEKTFQFKASGQNLFERILKSFEKISNGFWKFYENLNSEKIWKDWKGFKKILKCLKMFENKWKVLKGLEKK